MEVTYVALAVAGVALAVAVVVAVELHLLRRRTTATIAALRAALDERSAARSTSAPVVPAEGAAIREFVITDVVAVGDDPSGPVPVVPDRLVLSATVGEPLVKVVAFGHGVRRALAAESRHRIRFAMRREVRRARKQRKQEMKQAWRRMRAEDAGTAA